MKITEVREHVKKYKEADLRAIVAELYKAIPANKRDEKNIDAIIADYSGYINKSKEKNNRIARVDIKQLKEDVEIFVDNAYDQYYLIPNNVIHKKNRPKWRFIVKAFINDLQSIPADSDDPATSNELLKKLYEMLCYACGRYLFKSDDPFRSVGIEQPALYETIISRLFYTGINAVNIKTALKLALENGLDRQTLYSDLIAVFISYLKSTDARMLAIEQCKSLIAEYRAKTQTKSVSLFGDYDSYRRGEIINDLAITVFQLYIRLYEYDEAISYYYDNHKESNKEIILYVLLNMLKNLDLKDLWLREYRNAVKEGIKPREHLQREFDYIVKNDKFSETYNDLYRMIFT